MSNTKLVEPPELRPSVAYRQGAPTAADYDEVTADMQAAKRQLEPDGRNCRLCGDDGHTPASCHHNVLVLARRYTALMESEVYRCFHCGDTFTGAAAKEHFGKPVDRLPACIVAQLAAADLKAPLCPLCEAEDIYQRSPESCASCARLRVVAVVEALTLGMTQ